MAATKSLTNRKTKTKRSLVETAKELMDGGDFFGSRTGAKPTIGFDKNPTYFSPSYFYHNGRHMCVLQLYCRPGTNRRLRFDDIIDVIPVAHGDVDVIMSVHDSMVADGEKRKLIRKNSASGKRAIEITRAQGDEIENDAPNTLIQAADIEDYDDYAITIDSNDPLMGFKVQLTLSSKDRQTLEEHIAELNLALAQRHEGLSWDSTAGDQVRRVTTMFDDYRPNIDDFTSNGTNYAGLNFCVSPGLNDPMGLPIGIDVMSLSGATSFIDLEGSLSKKAIVASSGASVVNRYVNEDDPSTTPPASCFLQAIANHVCMRGARAHHVVLNGFDYFTEGIYHRPRESVEVFSRHNVATETINPLQGFGEIEEVVGVFSRLRDKIVNIFDVLEDLKLDVSDKAIILSAVEQFYFDQNLWNAEAAERPKSTRIVNIPNPETYPTMAQLISNFTTMGRRAYAKNQELKADRIDTLGSILNQALMGHTTMLARPTSIKNEGKLQTYYEFTPIKSTKMTQVQLLNIIEYIIWTADPGDVICIHGCDRVYERVFHFLIDSLNAAQTKGVRLAYGFDEITVSPTPVAKMASIFDLKGVLYNDLDTDVDYTIIGRCLPDEVNAFENALNIELSDTVRHILATKQANQFLIHRARGGINNFVYPSFVI